VPTDPWFLPPPPDEDAPLPRGDGPPLLDPAEWRAAQADCAPELAQASFRFGLLSARLASLPEGYLARLTLVEATEIAWFAGDRIAPDRLSLWLSLRATSAAEDTAALGRAAWAQRRLSGGARPDAGGWAAGLPAFLGRPADATAALAAIMDRAIGLHPLVAAHVAFRAARIALDTEAAPFEAVVLAARVAAADPAAAPFLPLALAGDRALRATGPTALRLRLWLTGAEGACRAALSLLDRVAEWDARARALAAPHLSAHADALITACAARPQITVAEAAHLTGASRATVQRLLASLTRLGVLRELTGQRRFRVWAARL
jgi:hypothetical protein